MRLNSLWSYLLRLVLSITLFWAALQLVDWPGARQMLITINGGWLALHFLCLLIERVLSCWKWHGLLAAKGTNVSPLKLFFITLIGKFWGMFLPSSIGVDVARGYYLYRYTGRGADSVSSVIVDKIIAVWAILLIGSIGIVVYGQLVDGARIGLYLFLIMAITAAILYLALRKEVAQWVTTRLPRYLGNTVGTALQKLYSSLLAYQEYPGALVKCFLLGLLMQFTRVLIAWTMAIALGIEIPFIYYFMFIPVSMILIMIPVSVGGFGVREGILVVLFSLAGFSTTDAFALGFGISLTDMVSSLFGGLIYLFVKFPVADSDGERPGTE